MTSLGGGYVPCDRCCDRVMWVSSTLVAVPRCSFQFYYKCISESGIVASLPQCGFSNNPISKSQKPVVQTRCIGQAYGVATN